MVNISPLETTKDLDEPKRVMKYILVYLSSGSLTLWVDEKALLLNPGDVVTITSGQIHYIKDYEQAKGFVLEFTLDFFCKDDADIELIFQNGLFCHFAMNEVIPVDKKTFENQLATMEEELHERPYQYLISVHSRIKLILIEINRAKVSRGDEVWKPDALFLKFLEAVRSNFQNHYSLARYADLLGTTELKLNELAKLHTGKTAQKVIYGLFASEAKRLLTYEKLSIKEVAYSLGFNDPFYFSNFFKKHTGISPKAYQHNYTL